MLQAVSDNLLDSFDWSDPSRRLICDGGSMRYGQMHALSGRLANAMASLGFGAGDRVAAQVQKSVAALALYLAALRVGAIFLPLNTGYTRRKLSFFIADAEPALIVCDPKAEAGIAGLSATRATVRTLDAAGRGSLTTLALTMPEDFATAHRTP